MISCRFPPILKIVPIFSISKPKIQIPTMIKIFRKIRQQLLTDNKFRKYLLYAIGEIVLVVIGILIALQINNSNEYHKKNIQETKFLLNIKNEFIKNQEELKDNIESHKYVALQIHELSKLMNPNPKEIASSKFDSLISAMSFIPEFKPVTTIVFSEKLELLKDENLKKLISSWSNEIDKYSHVAKINYDYYFFYIYPFLSRNYPMKNMIAALKMGNESSFDVDMSSVLSNSVFENHVAMRGLNAQGLLDQATTLFDLQKRIIEFIELKLEEYKE